MSTTAEPVIPEEASRLIHGYLQRLRRGEHELIARETGCPDIERLAFTRANGDIEPPCTLSIPDNLSPELIAAFLALAESNTAYRQWAKQELRRAGFQQQAAARADRTLMEVSQIIGGVQLIHRSALGEATGVFMEFSVNNLRFSYTDREGSAPSLEISSVGEYQIIEFELVISENGLTTDQLDRIEKADYNASWAGYGDNVVKYAKHPHKLAEIYRQEVIEALSSEFLGTAVSVDFFGGEQGPDADVLNIAAYRVIRNRTGVTSKAVNPDERKAVVVELAERFPQIRQLFGQPEDQPS
jgi:hypothetical protein